MIYLIFFILSASAGLLANKSDTRVGRIVLSGIAVLLPSILAGIRSSVVGTDNYYYFEPGFKVAAQTSKFSNVMFNLGMDPGTEFFFYIISRFTKDYHWVLFVFSFITNLFVYLSMWRERRKIGVFMPMMIYFLFLFCPFLCYVRQSVALAICIFAFHYANEGKLWEFCVLVSAATFMHTSAAVFFIVYPLVTYLHGDFSRKKTVFVFLFGFLLIFLAIRFLPGIVVEYFLSGQSRVDILANRYLNRDVDEGMGANSILSQAISISAPLLMYIFLYRGRSKELTVYMGVYVVAIILMPLCMLHGRINRITYYFSFLMIFILPRVAKRPSFGDKSVINLLSILYLLIYWYIYTVQNYYHFTLPVYPYISDIVSI